MNDGGERGRARAFRVEEGGGLAAGGANPCWTVSLVPELPGPSRDCPIRHLHSRVGTEGVDLNPPVSVGKWLEVARRSRGVCEGVQGTRWVSRWEAKAGDGRGLLKLCGAKRFELVGKGNGVDGELEGVPVDSTGTSGERGGRRDATCILFCAHENFLLLFSPVFI